MNYKYDKSLFDNIQCFYINETIEYNASKEILDIMTSLDKTRKPIFDNMQMGQIFEGVKNGLSDDKIKLYCKLNSDALPIYDGSQMFDIRYLLVKNYPEEIINILIKTENDVPLFNPKQMENVSDFILEANEKQIQQLKESINEGLTFNQLILDENIPAETMRILRSFYKLGCSSKYVKDISEKYFSYENLKELKNIIKYANSLGINPDFKPNSHSGHWTIDHARNELISIMRENRLIAFYDKESEELINKCIKINADLELVQYIFNPYTAFTVKEKQKMIYGYISGIDTKRMKNVLTAGKMNKDICHTIDELIEEIEQKRDIVDKEKTEYNFDKEER